MTKAETKGEPPAGDEKKSITDDESENAFAQGLHTGCHSTTSVGRDTPKIGVAADLPQTLDLSGFSGDCQSMTDKKESSPGWARTTDTRINRTAWNLAKNRCFPGTYRIICHENSQRICCDLVRSLQDFPVITGFKTVITGLRFSLFRRSRFA